MIDSTKYLELLAEPDFKIFGFSKDCLQELRRQYLLRGGNTHNITPADIIKVFEKEVNNGTKSK